MNRNSMHDPRFNDRFGKSSYCIDQIILKQAHDKNLKTYNKDKDAR